MAIALQNNKYNLVIDSKMIIGVTGDYELFLSSLTSDLVYFLDKEYSVSNKKVCSLLNNSDQKILDLIKEYKLGEDFLNKRINELSHSEQKLFKYLLVISSNKKIIVIDEPFMDLDYYYKKKIILLLKGIVKDNKTVIIGSMNSNIIYSLCSKVLLINKDSNYYGDISVLENKKILKKYHVTIPNIIKFVDLANEKDINLNYSKDIRDLIKDVYRNVSQK